MSMISRLEQENETKREEIAFAKEQDERQYDYALKVLAAQERDRGGERDHDARLQRRRMWFAGLLTVASLCFLGVLIYMGHTQTAKDIISLVSTIVGVSFGGYFWGKSKKD